MSDHGTYGAYQACRLRPDGACAPCRHACAVYVRRWREQRRALARLREAGADEDDIGLLIEADHGWVVVLPDRPGFEWWETPEEVAADVAGCEGGVALILSVPDVFRRERGRYGRRGPAEPLEPCPHPELSGPSWERRCVDCGTRVRQLADR